MIAKVTRNGGPSLSPTATQQSRESHPVTDIVLNRAFALANDAAFLWESRSVVAHSSAVTFQALARIDDRLSILLRALSKRPGLAQRLLYHEADSFPSGHAFVTAAVALQGGAAEVFEALVQRLDSEAGLDQALVSALSWPPYREVRAQLQWLLDSPTPHAARLGIAAAAAHSASPGPSLVRALESENHLLRRTALEAVGRLGAVKLRPRVLASVEDEDDACRLWAAWSAVRLGDRDAIPVLGRFAVGRGAFAKPACEMALRALDPDQAVRAQQRLETIPGNERFAITAAGIIGDPTLASRLFDAMESPLLARRAGASFSLMTGCDLRRDDLDGKRPSVARSDAGGDAVEDETDDELVWPDTLRLKRWWNMHRQAFVPGIRYLAGLPIRPTEMTQVLRAGNQQQRAAAAFELAVLIPDVPLFDVTAPAHMQIAVTQ